MRAVSFEGVSKRFVLHHERSRSFQEVMVNLLHRRNSREEFWALKEVSFEVEQGETFGIIGANGSGKSTVLKLLTRILEPTRGRIEVQGKVGALLELGAGFHPDLTGKENIYLNGSILGLGKREMDSKLEEIIAFSELERFIDTPIKHYSTGMFLRLGFAVAISLDPDVLLTDEVLAVGDETFQRKCMDKIRDLQEAGKTIVFVSHNLAAVRDLCGRALWLDGGEVKARGRAAEVVDRYLEAANIKDQERLEQEAESAVGDHLAGRRWGSHEVEIMGVEFLNGRGKTTSVFETGDRLIARLHYCAHKRLYRPVFGVAIHREDNFHINGPNTKTSHFPIDYIEGEGCIEYAIEALPLLEGSYRFSAAVYDESCLHCYDHHDRAYPFTVQPKSIEERYGIFYIPCQWNHRREGGDSHG